MDRTGVVVYALFATIFTIVGVLYVKRREEKKREIFSIEINSLITMIIAESCQVWGYSPSQRWWYIWRESFLEKKLSQYSACEEYISFSILSGKSWEKCKKLDFPANDSIEKFLNLRLKEVREYQELRNRIGRNFVRIDTFSRSRDVFLSINGDKCTFLFFDTFIFFTFAEVIVETKQIDWALNKSQSERLETDFGVGVILAKFEGSYVSMQFCTPRGWFMASLCREDFERAYAKAQKS